MNINHNCQKNNNILPSHLSTDNTLNDDYTIRLQIVPPNININPKEQTNRKLMLNNVTNNNNDNIVYQKDYNNNIDDSHNNINSQQSLENKDKFKCKDQIEQLENRLRNLIINIGKTKNDKNTLSRDLILNEIYRLIANFESSEINSEYLTESKLGKLLKS